MSFLPYLVPLLEWHAPLKKPQRLSGPHLLLHDPKSLMQTLFIPGSCPLLGLCSSCILHLEWPHISICQTQILPCWKDMFEPFLLPWGALSRSRPRVTSVPSAPTLHRLEMRTTFSELVCRCWILHTDFFLMEDQHWTTDLSCPMRIYF